jgi:WD40 repeat protein
MENPYRAAGTFSGVAYTERQADRDLFEAIEANQRYPYMLAPRQSGKSSLLLRIRTGLDCDRFRCGFVDLSTFRRRQLRDYDAFLLRFFSELAESLDVPPPKVSGRPKTDLLALLRAVPGPRLILLIDEVDALRRSRFKDTFFSDIRSIFNEREVDLELKRVQFVLAGAARVEELVTDTARSPFNVGKSIELDDFTPQEVGTLCQPLAGLGVPLPPELPTHLHHRTGGSVYLSQLLLEQLWDSLAREASPPPSPGAILARIDTLADGVVAHSVRDIHFRNIVKLLRDDSEAAAIWQRATAGQPLSEYEWDRLRSIGLTGRNRESIYRNRIYEQVFGGQVLPLTSRAQFLRPVLLSFATAVILALPIWWFVLKPAAEQEARIAALVKQIEGAGQDVPAAAYEELHRFARQKERADELMAQFWERRALNAEQGGSRDEAIVLWLKSWSYHDSPARELAARAALEPPFSQITATFRHKKPVNMAALSVDGTRVVTASSDETARVWDAATGKAVGEPLRHESTVSSAAFNKDGTRVVTGSWDKTTRIWDAATGAAVGEPLRHEGAVSKAVFSADGTRVAASADNLARVWDTGTGKALGEPLRHDSTVVSVVFSDDGARIVTASSDYTARIWDAATGKALGKPLRHENGLWSAVFSVDGSRVVTASEDTTARLWDAATYEPVGELLRHGGAVFRATFNANGTRVVTASFDKTARVWDVATGKALSEPLRHEARVNSAAFSADGARVVTASDDNAARLWDSATGIPQGMPLRHDASVLAAAFSTDGTRVLTTSGDNTARLWNAAAGTAMGKPLRHEARVSSAALSADDTRVVTACDDKTARVWDAATGTAIGEPLRHAAFVRSAAFSADGRRVVTASEDKTARVWDAATGKAVGEPIWHAAFVRSVAFSADGRRVVTGSEDKTARVWDATSGKALGELFRHEDSVVSAAFSPDGSRVVTASYDKTARVWDAATGKPVGEPLRHEASVNSAAFSPDGSRVVTASYDRNAQVWDAGTGKALGESLRHEASVVSACFSADGQWIITQTSACIRWWQRIAPDRFHLAGIRWTRGITWKPQPLSSRDGRTVKAVESITGDSVVVRTLTLGADDPALPVLFGSPAKLLADWQRKLGLRFEDETKSPKLIPDYGLSSDRELPKP